MKVLSHDEIEATPVDMPGATGCKIRCLIDDTDGAPTFAMRHFEVAPGGFTSLEKHLHTHIVIGARGTGLLTMGNRRIVVEPMDVVYLQPLEVHQLRNETREPFGFLCIVDHERDRPMKP